MWEATEHLDDEDDVEDVKARWRRDLEAARRDRGESRRAELSRDLAAQALPLLAGRTTVAAFVPYGTEPDVLVLLDELHRHGVRVLVPKLGPGLARDWAEFLGSADLAERAPRRPLEPSGPALPPEVLGAAQAVLVPALAVDRRGARLGRGAGWYDRALPHAHPDAPVAATVFDEEFLEDTVLPAAAHDVPVTHVVTPARLVALPPAA